MTEELENQDIDEAMAEEQAALDATTTRLGELESELANARDRHLRLAAEFDNYRKRIARDQGETLARAQAALITKLAEVLDDLDRVAHHSESANKEALLQGVEMVERKLRSMLEAEGLERFDPAGQPFDPAVMEALTTVPSDDPAQDDHVATVFAPGYRFQGTLIRPARVVVKKHEG
jgi:molecular chaperone GrpE